MVVVVIGSGSTSDLLISAGVLPRSTAAAAIAAAIPAAGRHLQALCLCFQLLTPGTSQNKVVNPDSLSLTAGRKATNRSGLRKMMDETD